MDAYRGTALLIFSILIFSQVSGQTLTLFGNTIIIKPDENVTCDSDLECSSCNEGRVCVRMNDILVQYGIITCDKDSSMPYCNAGLCSKIPEPGCDPTEFVCPADGLFPDPTNCTRYHICAQGSITTNQCPRNTVYDHVNTGCKYRRYPSDCVTFNCVGREGQPIVYPRDDRIYGRCVLGKPLILGRCEDYEKYDVTLQKCVRYCRTGGVQPPDPGSCGTYFLCVETSPKRYEPALMSCACNEGYDKELNACSPNAPCLKDVPSLCPKRTGDLSEENNDDDSERSTDNAHQTAVPFIINNSGNNNDNNNVSNGDDNMDGNLINGNDNGDNSDSGNVVNGGSTLVPFVINNSGDNNTNNKISNGDDAVDGNLVNGNGNANNSNSGNVQDSAAVPLIINSLKDSNDNNDISNDDATGSRRPDLQDWRQGRSLLRILIDWLKSKVRVPQAQPL